MAQAFPRLVKSLEGIGVDLDKTPFALGPWLELDGDTGDIRRAGRVRVQKGERLRLRFGVLLHSAATEEDVDLERAFRYFVSGN